MEFNARLLTFAVALSVPCAVSASPAGAADTPSGGAFANACAGRGSQMGGAGNAGQAYVPEPNFACNFVVTPGGSQSAQKQVANGAGSVNSLNYINNAGATALPGALHFDAHNNGNTGIPFPGAGADVGYNDHVTVTSLNGNSGDVLWALPFHLKGTITSETDGRGVLTTGAYTNFQLIGGGPAITAFKNLNVTNYGDVLSVNQIETVTVIGDGVAPSVSVDATVQFLIPITLGTAFDYGIWAKLFASERANGPAGPQNQTDADFVLTYLGGSYIILPDNSTDSNLAFTSAAGLDYNHAVAAVPIPASLGLLGLGLGALSGTRRRKSGTGTKLEEGATPIADYEPLTSADLCHCTSGSTSRKIGRC